MHASHGGAAGEQVHPATTQFSSARPGEDEAWCTGLFEQVVHHMQELGGTLHFVDHHLAAIAIAEHQFAETFWARSEFPECLGLQQVDRERVGKVLARPGGLAGSAGAEKEEAARWRVQKSTIRLHNAMQYLPVNSILQHDPTALTLADNSGASTFTNTSRPSAFSRATNTRDMPPTPSSRSRV